MSTSLYSSLNEILEEKFGTNMCLPPSLDRQIGSMTLNSFKLENCNLIIFYDSTNKPYNAWDSNSLSDPWGNKQTSTDLFNVSSKFVRYFIKIEWDSHCLTTIFVTFFVPIFFCNIFCTNFVVIAKRNDLVNCNLIIGYNLADNL